MKKLLILLLLCPMLAWANSWMMEEREGHYFVKEREQSNLFHAMNYTGKPRILQVVKTEAPLELIEYDAGTVGTSTLIRQVRRIIFNAETKKFLGDYIYKREAVGNDNLEVPQPIWQFDSQKKELIIKDSMDGEEQTTTVKY